MTRLLLLFSVFVLLCACSDGSGGASIPPPPPPPAASPPTPPPPPAPPPPAGPLFPDYNTSPAAPDATGMNSTAMEIAGRITLGWNLFNTLEAIGGETAWGQPMATQELMDLVKASGFDAVRIPASWDQYASRTTAKIDNAWLNRVAEVVQYAVNADLYVILNIHWDGGWLENNVTPAKKEEVAARQKAYWQQIATRMRNFDERVMFAGANEPNVDTAAQMDVLFDYHQTFIDAVRETGGRNAYRVLIVQGPSTDIEKTEALWRLTPHDTPANRLMMEVHYYTPWNFTGMTQDESWGNQFYYWGAGNHSATDPDRNPTWGEEATVDDHMDRMRRMFVDNGVPVILGEYGAIRRENLTGAALALHLASRAYFMKYVTQQSVANGLIPFHWGEVFDRDAYTVAEPEILDALLEGAGK